MHSEVKDILDFTLLFNKYKVQLYNYVSKMVTDRMTTEDIVQNIFLKLYENLKVIRIAESVNFWLFRTARNEIYMWYRKQKSYRRIFDPSDLEELEVDSGMDLSGKIEEKELSEIVNEEIKLLPENQKEVFILKEYCGLSYREIGDVMSIEEELVKSRLFKIRKKLTDRLSAKLLNR